MCIIGKYDYFKITKYKFYTLYTYVLDIIINTSFIDSYWYKRNVFIVLNSKKQMWIKNKTYYQ